MLLLASKRNGHYCLLGMNIQITDAGGYMRKFNVTGLCVPDKHYMVNIESKLAGIKSMVDNGDYFTVNRARQYGKTTTLALLEKLLRNEYTVLFICFEGLDDESFESADSFCKLFLDLILEVLDSGESSISFIESHPENSKTNFRYLSKCITAMCRNRKLVLIIDEVDKTSNNRVFLNFLGMLRNKYLARERGMDCTFHSVILAGVYNIKNIKLKMINEGNYFRRNRKGKCTTRRGT